MSKFIGGIFKIVEEMLDFPNFNFPHLGLNKH